MAAELWNRQPKSLSESFGEGLERFGQAKLKQLEHRNASQRLQATDKRITPEVADYLSTLPPKEQVSLLQSLGTGLQPQQQQQQQLPYDQNDPRAMAQYHLDRALKQQNGEELEPAGTGLGGQSAMQGQQFQSQQVQPNPQSLQQQIGPQQAPSFLQAIGRSSGVSTGSAVNQQKQNQIDSTNKPWIAKFEKTAEDAEDTMAIVNEMDQLLANDDPDNQVAHSAILGPWFQNSATQRFNTLGNNLATIVARQGGGVAGAYKIKFASEGKPNVFETRQAQKEGLDFLRKKAEKIQFANNVKNQLIESNGYNQPTNLGSRVDQIVHQAEKQGMFGKKKPNETNKETGESKSKAGEQGSTLGRGIARTAARAGEALIGLPGDVLSAGLGVGNYLSGGVIPKYSDVQQSVENSPLPNFLLPTSEDLRKKTSELTGGYTEPQGAGEKFYDDVVSDLATMAIPIKGKVPFKKLLIGSFGKSVAGNAASFLTKTVGGGPLVQAGAKLGAMTLAGTVGGRNVLRQEMNDAYAVAKDTAAKNNIIGQAPQVEKAIETELHALSRGLSTPAKKEAVENITSLQNKISQNRLSAADALQSRIDLNDLIYRDKSATKSIKESYKPVRDSLNDFLDKVGGTKHPEFGQNLNKGDDIYRALAASDSLKEFSFKHPDLAKLAKTALVKSLIFGAGGVTGLGLIGKGAALGLGGAALAGNEAYKAISFLVKSKEAQKYYYDVVQAGLKQDAASFARGIAKLDKVAKKYEQENK